MKLGIGALSALAAVVMVAACSEDDSDNKPSGPDAGGKAGSGSGGKGGSGGTGGGSGGTGGAATGGTGGASGGTGGATGGSAGAAGAEDSGADTADAPPDGCPLTPVRCADLGGLGDGSSFDTATSVLRLVVLSGADDLVSGTAEITFQETDCLSETPDTVPISIDTGALQLDLSTTGISSAGWRTCGPAELTLVDRCGDSNVIEIGLSYSSEGPILLRTCEDPDAGADAASDAAPD
jgi:hypothetical protein